MPLISKPASGWRAGEKVSLSWLSSPNAMRTETGVAWLGAVEVAEVAGVGGGEAVRCVCSRRSRP